MNVTIYYDGSFDGLLSAVFQIYARRYPPGQVHLSHDMADTDLFCTSETISTDTAQSRRVFQRLERQIGRKGMIRLLYGFLSAEPTMPDTFLRIVRLILAQPGQRDILNDYGHIDVMQWAQWVKSVGHEKHRMEAFVRFEELTDGLYLARIEPRYDVLPLIIRHFRNRYPEQKWAIFDMGRHYGIFSDSGGLHRISNLDNNQAQAAFAQNEHEYQQLWQRYFRSANIASRRNLRLQRQQMPQRYWKYLTELR